jgi:hypothetical protein
MFWAWVLKFDHLTARVCTLMFAMPIEWTGADFVTHSGTTVNVVTYTFMWSHILALPVFMIWMVIINEMNVFG